MVKLTRMEVESIGCTKLRGSPCYLDGDKLYFTAELRDKNGEISETRCCMDCSISRKKWDLVEDDQWPTEPQPWNGALKWEVYAYSLWVVWMHELEVTSGQEITFSIDRKGTGHWEYVSWKDCTFRDYWRLQEYKISPSNASLIMQKSGYAGEFTDVYDYVRQKAEEKATGQTALVRMIKNAHFEPMREIGEEETAFLVGLFNFDGDKKALCTALKSSWNADLSDKEVKVDSLITKKFTLPKPLEDYIP
jgi:hypothetical protein